MESWEVQRPWFCFWIYNHKQEVTASRSHRATSFFCLRGGGGFELSSQRQSCTNVCCSFCPSLSGSLYFPNCSLCISLFSDGVSLPDHLILKPHWKLVLPHLQSYFLCQCFKKKMKLVVTYSSHFKDLYRYNENLNIWFQSYFEHFCSCTTGQTNVFLLDHW